MVVDELDVYLSERGYAVEHLQGADGRQYVLIHEVSIGAGTLAGQSCDVAILHSAGNPWVPEAAIHVRPHLVPMGQHSSQASGVGADWQYLSRRFDRVPTPKGFVAHILTVLGEL